VRDAVKSIVGVQFRNLATVGGSIWGRFGFSDVLTVFMALGASAELYKKGIVPLEEFVSLPYDRDILVRIIVPKHGAGNAGFAAQSVRNSATDFPVLTVAAGCFPDEEDAAGTSSPCPGVRVAVGARPQKAMLLEDPEKILKDGVTEESAAAYAAWAAGQVPVGSNLRGSADYRKHLTEVLVRRALLKAAAAEKAFPDVCGVESAAVKTDSGGESAAVKTESEPEARPDSVPAAAPGIISFELNGRTVRREIAADLLLIDLVREEGALSVKRGCETSNCGLCTVLLDGVPVLSCSVLAARAAGRKVTTLEGMQEEAAEFGAFIADQGAEQCGFCNPGFIMNAMALFREEPDPSEEQIRAYLAGNLCRCSGYEGQLRGIQEYLAWKKKKEGTP
jgi:carbon-monoxide dehydrogenase small subunit